VDRRTRNLFALALVVVVAITGGAALILGGGAPRASDGPVGTTPVVGVVVAVDSGGLTDVRSFTLRTTDGSRLMVFGLTALENGVEFPPGHLAEHQLTGSSVKVWYRPGDDPLLAIRLEDAP
jgi:hypothetical protein